MISFIVPIYNTEEYLDKCITSIVKQTYQNIEIILVDDGSNDRSGQICDQWAIIDARIRVLHKKNGGVSSARNEGLKAARGEWIAFVDSDDYVDSKMCECVAGYFDNPSIDIIAFNSNDTDKTGTVLGFTENIQTEYLDRQSALLKLVKGDINNYLFNKVIRRNVFTGVWFPESRVWEDMATTYRLFMRSKRIQCLDEKLYYYVRREGSISKTINANALKDIFLARYECYYELKEDYSDAAEYVFEKVVLCAFRLYDRSLWESVDTRVLAQAQDFLNTNKSKVIMLVGFRRRLYYDFPLAYRTFRIGIHFVGQTIRRLKRIIKR